MAENYVAHHADVTVNAPVHQVYSLFTHFNDFPKFMSFIKEVTYYDNQTSHWVAEVAGHHEWDAVNDAWIPDRQIGWHSTGGLDNFGKVTFEPVSLNQTKVDVYVNYNPPAGIIGDIAEKLGAGSRFEQALQNDLNHFAQMVNQAPPGALDPTSSNYLFHAESAAAKGTTTARQNETMQQQHAEGGYRQPGEPIPPRPTQDETMQQQRHAEGGYRQPGEPIPPRSTEGGYRQSGEPIPPRPIEDEYRNLGGAIPPQHPDEGFHSPPQQR